MEGIKSATQHKPHLWWASDLMERLGYKDRHAFMRHIEEAVRIMALIEIPYYEHVVTVKKKANKKTTYDFQLSRFGCYLVVMLSDRKKEKVLELQGRFSVKAEKYGIHLRDIFELERLKIREELSEASKGLNSVAAKAEVHDFSSFNDAGYLGLYGMRSRALHDLRNLTKESGHQEYMGRTELAANLLRISLTEQGIWSKKIKGQAQLEKIHREVGNGIRKLIKGQTGKFPEQLPVYRELSVLKKQLKTGCLNMIETEK